MKNLISILTMVFIGFSSISCSKDDEPASASTQLYLAKTTFASIGSFTYNYDAQNKLSNVVFASSNEAANPSYTYIVKGFDGDKIKTAMLDYIDASKQDYDVEIRYNAAGKMIGENYYESNTTILESANTIEYISSTQVKRTSKNSANNVVSYDVYTYDAAGKNILEQKRFSAANVLTYTQSYSDFDDKLNYSLLDPKGHSSGIISQNNQTKTVYTPATGAVINYTYTYEYNTEGYVTKKTSASGAVNTYEYVKK